MAECSRHRAVYEVTAQLLAELLKLPHNVEIINADWNKERETVLLYCVGDAESTARGYTKLVSESSAYPRIYPPREENVRKLMREHLIAEIVKKESQLKALLEFEEEKDGQATHP